VTVENMVFAGAKEVDVVDAYEAQHGIRQFEMLIDWGWFYFITKPLFYVIDWLYRLLGNFGLAILATTVLVKAVFFPLANKSYVSMANMKKVQPKMLEIREKYADDKMKQQQAMMELYKTEKINPLAGCWPILIQIPVFFALYKVLYVTIEMRHAPFFGWIRDLAAPDPTSLFNLFGLLPYDVPSFLMVGVWPIIMGITMFLQMRMNPTPPDPTQAMIFNWMPVVFTFLLATFPAGLVIYWAWNNFLSILQQGVIMKRQGAKIELWDNLVACSRRSRNSRPSSRLDIGFAEAPCGASCVSGQGDGRLGQHHPSRRRQTWTDSKIRALERADSSSLPSFDHQGTRSTDHVRTRSPESPPHGRPPRVGFLKPLVDTLTSRSATTPITTIRTGPEHFVEKCVLYHYPFIGDRWSSAASAPSRPTCSSS
jgi:YidC/Oxa1 family membrane protein insertase